MIQKISLNEKLSAIADYWNPRIIGEINETHVKLVKFKGEFVWHHHEREDELFLVVQGSFTMKMRDGDVTIREGECIIIPRGLEHMPVAEEEVSVLLLEPKTTLNTGNLKNERTVENPERL